MKVTSPVVGAGTDGAKVESASVDEQGKIVAFPRDPVHIVKARPGNCADVAGAALVAWQRLEESRE